MASDTGIFSNIIRHRATGDEVVNDAHVLYDTGLWCRGAEDVDLINLLGHVIAYELVPIPAKRAHKDAHDESAAARRSLIEHYLQAAKDAAFGELVPEHGPYYRKEPERRFVPLSKLHEFLQTHAPSDAVRGAVADYDVDALAQRVRDNWVGRIRAELAPVNELKRKLERLLEEADHAVERLLEEADHAVEPRERKRARRESPNASSPRST